jgi:hypothetical protein
MKIKISDLHKFEDSERPQRPRPQKPKPRVTSEEEMKPKKKDTWIGVNKKQRW